MKRSALFVISAIIVMAGTAFGQSDTEKKVLVISSEAHFELPAIVPMEFIASEVLTVDAIEPSILEVLPIQVIERSYEVALRQNKAPPDNRHKIGY